MLEPAVACVCFFTEKRPKEWVLDTAETYHFFPNMNAVKNMYKFVFKNMNPKIIKPETNPSNLRLDLSLFCG